MEDQALVGIDLDLQETRDLELPQELRQVLEALVGRHVVRRGPRGADGVSQVVEMRIKVNFCGCSNAY